MNFTTSKNIHKKGHYHVFVQWINAYSNTCVAQITEKKTLVFLCLQTVCMPGQWLTISVVSRSFSWAQRSLWGPVPIVTVFKKGSSLEPAGSDLWLTFHDSSLFSPSTWRPSNAPWHPLSAPVYPLWALSFICLLSKTASFHEELLAVVLTLDSFFVYTEKENPYEDVDLKRKSFGRKAGLLVSSSCSTMDRKLNSPPQVSHRPAGIHSTGMFSYSKHDRDVFLW